MVETGMRLSSLTLTEGQTVAETGMRLSSLALTEGQAVVEMGMRLSSHLDRGPDCSRDGNEAV